eukprot:scaffold43816_cov33-Phaeocystis_antarctica.AAC.1
MAPTSARSAAARAQSSCPAAPPHCCPGGRRHAPPRAPTCSGLVCCRPARPRGATRPSLLACSPLASSRASELSGSGRRGCCRAP